MLFTDIVNSSNPLEALVRVALTAKSVSVTQGTLDRYTGLLEAALLADEGRSLEGNIWQEFVSQISGDKFEGCCNAIGQTIGASSSEIAEFLAIANSTGDVLAGKSVELAEEELFSELETISPTESEPYSHLDEPSKIAAISAEVGRGIASRSEPDHRAAASEGEASHEE